MIKYCQNCGRAHEGRLIEEFKDGDNKPIEIVVCEHPRYEEEDGKVVKAIAEHLDVDASKVCLLYTSPSPRDS